MRLVRRAMLTDATGIAAVHVTSWESTYRDILPAAYLTARTHAVRLKFWTEVLTAADPAICVFVACLADGSVCGFASGGPERTGLLRVPGELYAVYLLEGAQGLGLGRQLVEAVLAELNGAVGVWVLELNLALDFYKHLGGTRIAEQQAEFGGKFFTEVAYALGRNSQPITANATRRDRR
jgi:GNAT superfamily N-acetyltransferase